MLNIIKNNLLLLYLLPLLSMQTNAQNGMYFDTEHSFMIPMLENNVMKGHAYIYMLDKVSKDTNSYLMQVFDEHLRDVGEKKFNIDSKFTFSAAVFNGVNIVTKFQKKHESIRYIVFDQKAAILFDTVVYHRLRNVRGEESEINFQQTPIFSINNQGILDYLLTESGGHKSTTIQYLSNDNRIWQYTNSSSNPSNTQFLTADNRYIVNAIYNYKKRDHFNDVHTSIQLLTAQGSKIGETLLFKNEFISIYPISAEIQKNGIEVISEFTSREHEFSKIKFGTCIHTFDFNGKIISEHYNEFTKNLVKDSVFKKFKLLVHSYLYMHKALKLKNGNWLVAAEQLTRTRLKIRLGKNLNVIYNKKNICLMELDDHAEVVKIHVEPNKGDGVQVPKKYYRRPHNGALIANAKNGLDIDYFVRDGNEDKENISFIFTDYNSDSRKLSLGNLLYKNGEIKVDRFVVPTFTSLTKIGIYPARYGHVLLIKYDPYLGIFDFDHIKFNN